MRVVSPASTLEGVSVNRVRKPQRNHLLEKLETTRPHGSRPTSDHERIEVRCILHFVANGFKCLCEVVDLAKKATRLAVNNTEREGKGREDLLLNVRPLQLSGRLEVVDLRSLPWAFTKFTVFFETGVNQLLDGSLLLLRSGGKSILE